MLKFIYSEKATKFCEISTLDLTVCTVVKFKVEISQNYVAFSEYMDSFFFGPLFIKSLENLIKTSKKTFSCLGKFLLELKKYMKIIALQQSCSSVTFWSLVSGKKSSFFPIEKRIIFYSFILFYLSIYFQILLISYR